MNNRYDRYSLEAPIEAFINSNAMIGDIVDDGSTVYYFQCHDSETFVVMNAQTYHQFTFGNGILKSVETGNIADALTKLNFYFRTAHNVEKIQY